MLRGIYQNSSSMILLQEKTDAIANNMANVDTPGYKKKGVFFQQLTTAEEALKRNQIDVKLQPYATPTYVKFSDGVMQETGNPLDIGLNGNGFFAVKTPNGIAYTRAGSFRLTNEGELIMPDGNKVLGESGPIEINGGKVQVTPQGEILIDGVIVNKFMLKTFDLQSAVSMNNNYYYTKENTEVKEANPSVTQGFLEKSNVNIVNQMTELIAAQKHYEANHRLITAQDQTLEKVVNQMGK